SIDRARPGVVEPVEESTVMDLVRDGPHRRSGRRRAAGGVSESVAERVFGGLRGLPLRPTILAVFATAIAGASVAHAQSVSGELRVGGGWDSNPAFAAEPGNRRVPAAHASSPRSAGLFAVAGFASTTIG